MFLIFAFAYFRRVFFVDVIVVDSFSNCIMKSKQTKEWEQNNNNKNTKTPKISESENNKHISNMYNVILFSPLFMRIYLNDTVKKKSILTSLDLYASIHTIKRTSGTVFDLDSHDFNRSIEFKVFQNEGSNTTSFYYSIYNR